jgi:predicted exporter
VNRKRITDHESRFTDYRAVCAWLVLVAACALAVSRTTLTTDVSAFLPRSPTPAQQVLVDQLRDGVVSRLILAAVEGGTPEARAHASKRLAAELRPHQAFVSVNNGENAGWERDREFLWRYRYLLSPGVTAGRFSVEGLRARLEEHLHLLASPAGPLLRQVLPRDPTGELLQLIEQAEGGSRPALRDGVWVSGNGNRALLLIQTRAAGYDIDGQEGALAIIREAFARVAGASDAKILLTGPGVFAVNSRAVIKEDALRFSLIAFFLIATMMLVFYRSPRILGIGLLPVMTGALAGIAAVSLGFGSVHGITLGFGITLLGEGIDYAIYLFTQTAPGIQPHRALDRIWPTLRLGVMTSICGFSAMLLSGFSGLAQLGLFSITGLVVAATVTRCVMPALMPAGYTAPVAAAFGEGVMAMVRRARVLRYPVLAAVVAGAVFLMTQRGSLWSDDLASLTPVPQSEQLLDRQLRRDLGAPDVRYLALIHAADSEAALQAAETASAVLRDAAGRGLLVGHDSPAAYLPSLRTQQLRQAAMPPRKVLQSNLRQALQGLPYRPGTFDAFLADAEAARTMTPVNRSTLQGTNFELKVNSLLVQRDGRWTVMMPLRGVTDAAALQAALDAAPGVQASLLDLKGESERLYADYRREAVRHSLLGALAIVVLLSFGLRSARRVLDVLAPLAAAVVVATAMLAAGGALSIFHLVGLLLVVAVGSNYSLFFERQTAAGPGQERTVVSLLLACASTIIGFGLLSFSSVPVLSAIGSTVGLGTALALLFSAILSRVLSSDERHT